MNSTYTISEKMFFSQILCAISTFVTEAIALKKVVSKPKMVIILLMLHASRAQTTVHNALDR